MVLVNEMKIMEGGVYRVWKNSSSRQVLKDLEDNDELRPSLMSSLSSIPLPKTPHEPMEFLGRSWSLSAAEISKALSDQKQNRCFLDMNADALPETLASPQLPGKVISSSNGRLMGTIGKWFHHYKESGSVTVTKKDRTRLQNGQIHSALSIAGLAVALAAITSEEISNNSSSKLGVALASATELLASYCIEMAELAGADHDRVASTVRSAISIQTPGDLTTLTAAAATALRADAVLRARFPNEPRKNASLTPHDQGVSETQCPPAFPAHMEERDEPCVGDLLQLTHKGALRRKRAYVYINKKSQVIVKLKSKHVGGTFSKKQECVVYGVCDDAAAWPYQNERHNKEDFYFGLKTEQGLLEFKCTSKIHKQQWVDGVQSLLRRVSYIAAAADFSLDSLSVSRSI